MIPVHFRHDAVAIYYSPDEVAKEWACFSPANTIPLHEINWNPWLDNIKHWASHRSGEEQICRRGSAF